MRIAQCAQEFPILINSKLGVMMEVEDVIFAQILSKIDILAIIEHYFAMNAMIIIMLVGMELVF